MGGFLHIGHIETYGERTHACLLPVESLYEKVHTHVYLLPVESFVTLQSFEHPDSCNLQVDVRHFKPESV